MDYEYLADRTEGFSGADLAAICKAAAKTAIRRAIAAERKKFEEREEKRKEADEKGEPFVEPEDDGADLTPFITRDMLLSALSGSRRSVTKQDLERYMKYKRDMERRLGMDEGAGGEMHMGPVVGLDAENRGRPLPGAIGSGGEGGTSAPPSRRPARRARPRPGASGTQERRRTMTYMNREQGEVETRRQRNKEVWDMESSLSQTRAMRGCEAAVG